MIILENLDYLSIFLTDMQKLILLTKCKYAESQTHKPRSGRNFEDSTSQLMIFHSKSVETRPSA